MMKKNLLLSAICICAILHLSLLGNSVRAQQIIAYYSGKANQINRYYKSQITEIIFSFCHLSGNRLTVGNKEDELTIRTLVALKKKNKRLKILLSLGGWGGCKTCSDVFSTDSGRKEFAQSVFYLINYFHADGIDLDWEFPSLPAYPDYPFKVEDKVNFTLLIKILRAKLGKSKEISVICAGVSPFLEGSLDLPDIAPYLDRINLMTYDLIGSKIHFSGHHTPLYSTSWQTSSVNHALRHLDSLKIPHNKICIGSAFYGREYLVLDNKAEGLNQPAVFQKFITMKDIRKEYTDEQGYTTHWDSVAEAPYKFNVQNGIFITYDDERSVAAKVKYLKDQKLNGIFFWEMRLDRPKDGLMDVIFREMKK